MLLRHLAEHLAKSGRNDEAEKYLRRADIKISQSEGSPASGLFGVDDASRHSGSPALMNASRNSALSLGDRTHCAVQHRWNGAIREPDGGFLPSAVERLPIFPLPRNRGLPGSFRPKMRRQRSKGLVCPLSRVRVPAGVMM